LIQIRLVKFMQMTAMRTCAQHGFLSSIWYLFSGSFKREQKAVLSGRYRHKSGLELQQSNHQKKQPSQRQLRSISYTLRRNVHRLEKGLIMKPRRDVFALDYIATTVSLFGTLIDAGFESNTIQWTQDVLAEYFRVADKSHPKIQSVSAEYRSIVQNREGLGSRATVHHLALRRRSCRWFKQEPVCRKLIDRAIEIGTLAPSACNRQPFKYLVFDDPDEASRIGAMAGGTGGFAQNFPCLAAVVGDFSAYPFERDRHLPYIDGSLATMGFLFGLEVLGLSSCCINWPDVESSEIQITEALSLEPDERVIMLIAIGHPDPNEMVPYSQKKSLDSIREYFEGKKSA